MKFSISGSEFIPDKPVQLFQQPALGAGTTVRATYDVAPDGRFLLKQAVPESVEARTRQIFPSSFRVILNWNEEVKELLSDNE